jgi:hypothetical protein
MLGKHMRCLALTFLQLLRVVSPSEGSRLRGSGVFDGPTLSDRKRMGRVIAQSGRKWSKISTARRYETDALADSQCDERAT